MTGEASMRGWAVLACALLAAAVLADGAGGGRGPADGWQFGARRDRSIVVAQDGSGDFRTVQEAVDSIPKDNAYTLILLRNGTYREKVFINASHVSIVGEDRERTRIEYAELRRIWRETHPDDWGAAVVNIGDKVTDLVIANLTVRNDYGKLRDDHDHQFAIRSGGDATRITLLDANVIADGGDTLSLWNANSGMYYHANCSFEGWVDYVCPRGWCYITNSRFFGHNMTASIWHDGSKDKDSKFVIRHSWFDGVPGFPLGRNNRDGQFFLLDAHFSPAMGDRPIYQALAPETYQWPARYYYDNCHRDGGDYAWFADNLDKADGTPRAEEITAAWTFAGRWDPENTLPSVLPRAAIPQPADGARNVNPADMTLRWIEGRNAAAHRVYLGTTSPPPFREERRERHFKPGPLKPGARYYWRIDELTGSGIVIGSTWQFTTSQAKAPSQVIDWSRCLDQPREWYAGDEATRIADNVLLYQRRTGGWPKNIDMAAPLDAADISRVTGEKSDTDSTIDNDATTTQIRLLARVLAATGQARFKAGVVEGLRYLFDAQYANGGWPQFFPLRADYSRHITFNDDAMVRVMTLVRDVAEGREPFSFVDAATRARAAGAFERGVLVVLATQVKVKGVLTAWCAQHDEITLEPRPARAYELVSLSGRESVAIVRFLMTIERPKVEVVRAIDAAVAWLRAVEIRGWRLDRRDAPGTERGFDNVLVPDPAAPPLWARFYEIGTNRPMYVGRDGVVRDKLSDVEYERRTGYSYIGPYADRLLADEYPAWQKRVAGNRTW
jgi:PelA/Pel-15E family pectate lyase